MQPWQARCLVERTELEQRLENLNLFMSQKKNTNTLTLIEIHDLQHQRFHMQKYLDILTKRIAEFNQ